ncbi:LINE-1 retrotransposable element ORF2 protein [Vitis vinifera]|uniref:LINE-1 retrotransposable element ORF2 protein n=1 Tax=Vitis vinifera TaxID=29760 RepID=A0A438C2D1_VITVI|nr:LINE-1 retrotransposable element ORF2 protein [Vitis vinifera]
MVKVQSVLESLRVRIVKDNGKGVEGENKSALSADKILSWNTRGLGSRKKRRTEVVSSVWKGKSLDWVALPACGASGGIVILWDSVKFNLYGPNKAVWRKDFWLELQDLHGLTFPRWCVGGDFNVIRRISEKMGDSRLTVNMRCFDEFIRESGLLDPPLRNAAFTWSNMQVDPICKRLDRFLFSSEWDSFFSQSIQEALPRWTSDHSPICLETNPFKWGPTPFRFENMWLLHPEFKEKFRDWWQECTVEGWEGHKFMRKLKFIKSKLKEWNIVVFGDLRERKKHILTDLGRIDRIEQEGNLNLDLVSERTLRRKELEDLLLKEEFFQLNKEKAPGPDGFTIAVYQECWDVIKDDLMRVFFKFHTKGVLSGRLRKVLHETIFGSQGAFVEGRQILDAVLIANEVVDEKRRSGEEGVVFKIDFEKAYDHVDWGFLDHVLQRKGFSQKWRSWMRGCLSSSSFAILVNGNAKGWVKASRGLRQGDPLSPFLFTLVADVLSRLMIRAEETGITEGFLVGRDRTRVSLLQFADDTIFFSKASLDFFKTLRLSFWFLGKVSEWPLSYLGLPLGGNPKTIGFWDPVVERISRRLDGWKKAYLSLGGRITLIQSCLSHILSYFLSLFKIPVSIASKIEKMQRDFFGLGPGKEERSPNQMEVVSKPKEMGGSLEKGAVFGIRLLRVYMGHILMDGTPTWWLDGLTDVLGRLLLKFSRSSPFCPPSGGQWGENSVLGRFWWGNQTLCSQFADLYRVIL